MGLDITAYRQLRQVIDLPPEESDEWYELLHVFNISEYASRAAPLIEGAAYASGAKTLGFRAGSYSGYGEWRNLLAKLAGYPPHPAARAHPYSESAWAANAGPFWELINFADNEGVIGSAAAAKLAADFAAHDAAAMRATEPWFYSLYRTWRDAFEMAADGGAVAFH